MASRGSASTLFRAQVHTIKIKALRQRFDPLLTLLIPPGLEIRSTHIPPEQPSGVFPIIVFDHFESDRRNLVDQLFGAIVIFQIQVIRD